MYMRSDSMTVTVQQERFACSRMATRSTEPEVFTFERIPAQATAVRSCVPIRPKKRCTRVMYPAKVRMHLPPPERSPAKRWLLVLCLVVLWQIYTEEPCADTPPGNTGSSTGDWQAAAEERPLQLAQLRGSSNLLASQKTSCEDGAEPMIAASSCPTAGREPPTSRTLEQSAGRSYMVALLVYHRLGSDN